MTITSIELLDFLDQLHAELDVSLVAYKRYFTEGKLFLEAQSLKKSNDSIRNLLLKHRYLLPSDQIQNADTLVYHLDIWATLWEKREIQLKPNPDDLFVFENQDTFPKNAVDSLQRYYESLNARENLYNAASYNSETKNDI